MACLKNGNPWPQGEASYASELGRLHGFRRWCETPLVELRAVCIASEGEPAFGAGFIGEVGPAHALLAPVRLHLACKLGRKWVCLNCFAVEDGGVATFRRARCAGRASIGDAGRALLNAVVRYGPRAGLMGAAQGRLAELWAAAGCQLSVLTPAVLPEPGVKILRLSAIGLALAGAQLTPRGAEARRAREAPSPVLGAGLGFVEDSLGDEACVKRRRHGSDPGAAGSSSQAMLRDSDGTKEVNCDSTGSLRSSALGQALLFGVRGRGRVEGAEAAAPGGHRVQGALGTLVQVSAAGQRSRLGEAVSAEDRRELKSRRLCGGPEPERPCSQGALDAIAACRDVEVASSVAAWPLGPGVQAGRRGSSSSGPAGPC